MYTQDYDEYLSGAVIKVGPGGVCAASTNYNPWGYVLQPYIKSSQVLNCPSAGMYKGNSTCNTYKYTGYGWNYNALGQDPGSTGSFKIVKTSQVLTPTEVIMFADDLGIRSGSTVDNGGYYTLERPSTWTPNPDANGNPWWSLDYGGNSAETLGRAVQRHFEGANFAYVDGHVKYSIMPGPVTQDATLWTLH